MMKLMVAETGLSFIYMWILEEDVMAKHNGMQMKRECKNGCLDIICSLPLYLN